MTVDTNKNRHKRTKEEQSAHKREYYAGWRKRNKEKIKKYTHDYWMRKFNRQQKI